MNERQRIALAEKKMYLLNKAGWICEAEDCMNRLTLENAQLAHRIPQTKSYLKKYGKEVIHNDLNIACVCSLHCNAAVLLDPKTNPVKAQRLIDKIEKRINDGREEV